MSELQRKWFCVWAKWRHSYERHLPWIKCPINQIGLVRRWNQYICAAVSVIQAKTPQSEYRTGQRRAPQQVPDYFDTFTHNVIIFTKDRSFARPSTTLTRISFWCLTYTKWILNACYVCPVRFRLFFFFFLLCERERSLKKRIFFRGMSLWKSQKNGWAINKEKKQQTRTKHEN